MKSLLILIAVLALILTPVLAMGQADQTAAATNPPISQPLVREGSLAVALAQALQIGTVTDEAGAESMLSSAGIAPKNGWIADYPVTPEIVGDLQNAVVLSAESGKLKMNKDDAVLAFQDVADKYGLTVKEDESGGAAEVPSAPSYYDNPELNDYYYDEGPPMVTYYAPPPAYAYLYDWVPYPFWWSDFWFPGFFVLVDFDTTIFVHGHHEHFSNHFFDHDRDRFARISPEHRFHRSAFAARGKEFRGAEVHDRRDVTGGMNAITRWRSGYSTGSRSFNVSPGGRTQVRQPYRGASIASSGGRRVTIGQPATNWFSQFHASNSFGRQNVPARVAPPVSSMRSSGSYSRPFQGSRTFGAARSWEGGRSFGGFSGSAGSYSRPSVNGGTFGPVSHWGGGHSFGGFRGSAGGGFRR